MARLFSCPGLEDRDRFDMRGMREHVDDTGGAQPPAAFMHSSFSFASLISSQFFFSSAAA